MRFCGAFSGRQELGSGEKCPQNDRVTGESGGSALLAIDDADRGSALQAGLPKRLDGLHGRASGGHHVLHETHSFAGLELAFEAFGRTVVLRLLAHDHERQAGMERRRGKQRDGSELGAREPGRVGLGLRDGVSDPGAERLQQLRPRLEAVLVQVVARAPARAQYEVALEVGVLDERGLELRVRQCSSM
jgi:hypothetical protein